MLGVGDRNKNIQTTRKDMKAAIAIIVLAVILALTTEKPNIEDRVAKQIEESRKLHDSAMVELKRLHDINDTLLIYHFGK